MAVPHDCTQLCEGCEPSVLGFIPRLTIASFAPLRQESTQPITQCRFPFSAPQGGKLIEWVTADGSARMVISRHAPSLPLKV